MKKPLRIISLILAVVMTMSCMSVLGFAKASYRGNDSSVISTLNFDDVNSAVYTTEQYATMALDEVDRMLDEADLAFDVPVLGTISLKSVDDAVASINSAWGAAGSLKSLLGDAENLNLSAIQSTARSNGSDTQVFYDVLDLLGDLAPIAQLYVNGNLSLGILDSVIAAYKFNVRELVFGLLCQLTGLGVDDDYDYFDSKEIPARYKQPDGDRSPTIVFLQDLVNNLLLGEWVKLDDLFYSSTNKGSHVVYDEYIFHVGSASGAVVTDETPNTAAYDYYGWVHPDEWVTFGLGDAIRVANNAAAPAPSYTKVDFSNLGTVYDLVESLLLQAYNGIAVPVLNRITLRWLREKSGYEFDESKTERYLRDANGDVIRDANDEPVENPDYDYLYMGDAPAGGIDASDKIFKVFDVDNLKVPYATVNAGETFIQALNRNAIDFVDKVLLYDSKSVNGAVTTYNWVDPENAEISYSFDLTTGTNDYLFDNIINVLRFILQVTEEEFFSRTIIDRHEYKYPAELETMNAQELLSYIIRSVVNASVDYMYIPENTNTRTVPGAALEAVVQLAYEDIPQFTYTVPNAGAYNNFADYSAAALNKALAILMDIAVYNINAGVDAEKASASDSTYSTTNNGSTNNTGLLAYLGENRPYGNTVAALAAWGVTTWASTTVGNSSVYQCLLNIDLASDNYGGDYGPGKVTEDTAWADIDAIVNSLIPIKGTDSWLSDGISINTYVIKAIIFDYLVYPILNCDWTNIYDIFERSSTGVLGRYDLERVLLDTLRNIFNLLFPNVFDATVIHIDDVLNNELLGKMVSDLLHSISATRDVTGQTNNTQIVARGKIIAGVALPIVCKILGLDSKQEFGEMENYLPSLLIPEGTSASFQIYNGSSGVNTSYRDKNDNYKRKIDNLYNYAIRTATSVPIGGGGNQSSVSGISNSTIVGSEPVTVTLGNVTTGQTLKFEITYDVLDENGQSIGSTLSSTRYTYVASDSTKRGDGEAIASTTIGGKTITYAPNIYLNGGKGLSSVDGYSIQIKDNKTAGSASITSAALTSGSVTGWLSKETDTSETQVSLSGEEGTYILYPFAVDSDSYTRTQYEYQKDEDDSYVLDEWGMRIKQSAIVESGVTNVGNGVYVARIGISAGGETGTIEVYIHLYDDYGLESYLNRAISANYSNDSVIAAGATAFNNYSTAIQNAVVFTYAPDSHGYLPGTRANGFENFIASSTAENKYLELYRALYAANEALKPYLKSSGAEGLWNLVNQIQPYNYTRQSFNYAGTTLYYKDYLDYNDAEYGYMGMRNYVAHTYITAKSAINHANSLINREYKYIGYTEEEFNELSTEAKEKVVEAYLNDEPSVISSVDYAYAEHMLRLTSSRLIELPGNDSKLVDALTTFGGQNAANYSAVTFAPYSDAVAFANSTVGSTNGEQITKALNELVYTWKHLAAGADYTFLADAINEVSAFLGDFGFGINFDGSADFEGGQYQDTYTTASFMNLLEVYDRAYNMNEAAELSESQQSIVDDMIAALQEAFNGLVEAGEGGEDTDFYFELDESYECEGYNGEIYNPIIDDAFLMDYGIEEVYTDEFDYIPVSGTVFGIPAYADEEMIAELFYIEGGEAYVIPYGDAASSGSIVVLLDENGEVQDAYVLALRGDLNGDGSLDMNDINRLRNAMKFRTGYLYDDPDQPESILLPATDLNGDEGYDNTDINFANRIYKSYYLLDQAYGDLYVE